MALYAFTVFLSAFLLFQVQTLLAKWLLPWYGGVPAVWTACLLFFQITLLLGYAYAHGLTRLPARWQARLHLAVIAAALAALAATALAWGTPLLPADTWKPLGDEDPVWHLTARLALAVGAPFFALAATTPLVQHWYGGERRRAPYRLYALSNLGSLLGLLTYPFVVEPLLPLRWQAHVWWLAFLAFTIGIAALAWRARRIRSLTAVGHGATASRAPTRGERTLWFALPTCASVLLLAITNQLSQEIAVVPLIWVLPLSLYLASFILSFAGERWYPRNVYLAALVPALGLVTLALEYSVSATLWSQVLLYSGGLYIACMVLHGELARLKPAPHYATAFYLTITAGGAAGGLFVGLVAPRVFPAYWELSLGLWVCAALALIVLWRDRSSVLYRGTGTPALLTLFSAGMVCVFAFADQWQALARIVVAPWTYGILATLALAAATAYVLQRTTARVGGDAMALVGRGTHRPGRALAVAAAVAVFGIAQLAPMYASTEHPIAKARNFFGIVEAFPVIDADGTGWLKLRHGLTVHGWQRLAPGAEPEPHGYYARESGIGQALDAHPLRRAGEPMHVGVVGLGTGTLAAYGRDGDVFRFYEINPAVTRLSQAPGRVFTYLRDSRATIDVVPGDARLSLDRERGRGLQRFDVLVLDAFNSGSIPAHLLTTEAIALYLARLAPEHGLLALHISNRFLDLRPLVWGLAEAHGLTLALVEHADTDADSGSVWALLAHRAETLPVAPSVRPPDLRAVRWRDDYTNLLTLIRPPQSPARAASPAALEAAATALDPGR